MIDDHSRQGRSRIKQTAIHHQNPNVLSLDSRLPQELIDGSEHDGLRLLPGLRHAGIGRHSHHGLRQISLLPQAGPLENLLLKPQILLRKTPGELRSAEKRASGAGPVGVGLVAGEVEKVDLSGSGHDVEGGQKNDEGRTERDRDEVELEVVPEVEQVLELQGGEMGGGGGEQGEEEEVHGVGDEIMVAELDVFEADGAEEIGESGRRDLWVGH